MPNKTISPKTGLGVAGGAKYMCQGIYFKLALDVKINSTTWLYGGTSANDEKGVKVSSGLYSTNDSNEVCL